MSDTVNSEKQELNTEPGKTLTQDEIKAWTTQVPEWELLEIDGEQRIRRKFDFDDFAQALAFTNQVGEQAEAEQHHPRIVLAWGEVTVDWWTHSAGGLQSDDFNMAVWTDDIYSRWDLISGEKDSVEEASDESFPASDPPAW